MRMGWKTIPDSGVDHADMWLAARMHDYLACQRAHSRGLVQLARVTGSPRARAWLTVRAMGAFWKRQTGMKAAVGASPAMVGQYLDLVGSARAGRSS